MRKRACSFLIPALVGLWVTHHQISIGFAAQGGPRAVQPRQSDYGRKFFDQLRSLFGRFRDTDLDRAFEMAQPIQCSTLISGDGEWRPVAFFNEDRKLGDWYHGSIEEVKGELSQYIFQGMCASEHGSVQLVTKFPVRESIDRYNDGRIRFDQIRLNVNPAVTAYFEPRTGIYTFDLPFLYINQERSVRDAVYSLIATRAVERPASDVTNHWECKSVQAADLTFQFLICQTWTLPRSAEARRQSRPSFGSSAYFILSDGREATTSIKLSFGISEDGTATAETRTIDVTDPSARTPDVEDDGGVPADWQIPPDSWDVVDLQRREFRMRFNAQSWDERLSAPQVLVAQRMLPLVSAEPAAGADYCVWQPYSSSLISRVLANDPEMDVDYAVKVNDADKQSSPAITFEMKTFTGTRLATLQCFFPKADPVTRIPFDRWAAIVGPHIVVETRP